MADGGRRMRANVSPTGNGKLTNLREDHVHSACPYNQGPPVNVRGLILLARR